MYLLIVTFKLVGLTDAEYRRGCEMEAPSFSAVPGLASKVWLADPATSTYGGVYSFISRSALDTYLEGGLFASIRVDPTITDLTTTTFEVLEAPTRTTHGLPAIAV